MRASYKNAGKGEDGLRRTYTSIALCAGISLLASAMHETALAGAPFARIKESLVCCPQESVTIDGWASIDPGGEVVQWQWDLGGDGKPDRFTAVGEVRILTPREPRTYQVMLRVLDNEGNLSAPDTASLCVMQAAPQVRMPADTLVRLGARIFFRPAVRTTCGAIERYEWDFDNDGTYEYSSRENGNTSRPFFRPGKYLARFRAIDANGREGAGVMIINVMAQLPATEGK